MREPVPLAKACRLLNHGPTVLVTSAHNGRRNVMAAALNMALDFDPPKIAVVIDKSTVTRELVEALGKFSLNVPARGIASQVQISTNGSDLVWNWSCADSAVANSCGLRTQRSRSCPQCRCNVMSASGTRTSQIASACARVISRSNHVGRRVRFQRTQIDTSQR
jgi:hypothetical protein